MPATVGHGLRRVDARSRPRIAGASLSARRRRRICVVRSASDDASSRKRSSRGKLPSFAVRRTKLSPSRSSKRRDGLPALVLQVPPAGGLGQRVVARPVLPLTCTDSGVLVVGGVQRLQPVLRRSPAPRTCTSPTAPSASASRSPRRAVPSRMSWAMRRLSWPSKFSASIDLHERPGELRGRRAVLRLVRFPRRDQLRVARFGGTSSAPPSSAAICRSTASFAATSSGIASGRSCRVRPSRQNSLKSPTTLVLRKMPPRA